MSDATTGKIVIISGPSGAGKSTIVRQLMAACPLPLTLSVSATTRSPRPGEQEGREYYFLTHHEFARRRAAREFLECKEVFGRGDWYGTLREPVTTGLRQGKWVILEIDVEGAMSVLEQVSDCVTIFLDPGSVEELERRLRGRATDSEEAVQRRLEVARREFEFMSRYQHRVVNDRPERAVQEISDILQRCSA